MRDCMVTLTFTGPEGTILDLNLKTIQIILHVCQMIAYTVSYLIFCHPQITHMHTTRTPTLGIKTTHKT